MTNHVLLDNVLHKNLTVKQVYAAEYGHDVGAVITFATELSDIQREYPIMLHRDSASNRYHSVAMLGLVPDENLFLHAEGRGWDANYVPAIMAKGPFLIGYEDQSMSGGERNAAVIHVDLDDPRVNAEDGGTEVFKAHGGNTDYLESIAQVLNAMEQGAAFGEKMFEQFDALGLIEPLAMDIELVNGEKIRVEGHHTINQQRLSELSAQELFALNSAGFLQGAFLIVSSLSNVKGLIARKNGRIASK